MDCNKCQYACGDECSKYAMVYVGYNPNNPLCQSCDKDPQIVDGIYLNCNVVTAHYKDYVELPCIGCPKSLSCTVKPACGGLNSTECIDCYRQSEGGHCIKCDILLSEECIGLDSDICMDCPKKLDCRTCPEAWKHPKVRETCDFYAEKVELPPIVTVLPINTIKTPKKRP